MDLRTFPARRYLPTWANSFIDRIVPGSFILGIGASVIFMTVYASLFGGASSASALGQTTVAQVTTRSLVSSVKATGKVTFASEQQLKFNQKGTVAKVLVKEGDKVKQGTLLAELDKSTVNADIRTAQLSVGASALQLQQLQADKEKTIMDAQNSVNETARQLAQARSDLLVSQQKLPADLEAAKQDVQERTSALEQAKLDLEKQKQTELQSLASTAQNILNSSDKILDSIFSVLTRGRDSRPTQGNYELNIDSMLYNDQSIKNQVEFSYNEAVNESEAISQTYYSASALSQKDPKTLLQALADAEKLAQSVQDLSEHSYDMLQGASTGTTGYTPANLTSDRSTLSANRTTAAGLVDSAVTAQANLSAASLNGGIPSVTLKQKQDAVTSAENALEQSQANEKVLETQTPADLAAKQDALQKTQEALVSQQQAYDSTVKSTDVNISLHQNDVAQRATAEQKSVKTLQDYELRAPFDGVVTHIDYKVGDNLLDTGDTENLVLQNPDFIIVTIPLDQVDVVRVLKGMTAQIAFDALPGQSFSGAIDEIDPTPIEQSGVVSYNVSVKLPTPQNLTILSGMTATVTIEISRKDNVLAVPNLALSHSTNGRTTVKRANGTSVSVETGMTDGRYTEITSGLQDGDSVVSVNVSVTASSAGQTNGVNLFRLGGGGGAGFGGGAPGGGAGGGGRTGAGGAARGN